MNVLKRLGKLIFILTAIIGVIAGATVIAAPQIEKFYSAHHSERERIRLKDLSERSIIYDRRGGSLGVLTDREDPQNRVMVPLERIPDQVRNAVIAVEDADFHRHKGVNIRSIARAVDANLQSGDVAQGGSTITQQVIKNSEVGDEQSFSRKLREAFLAVELEKQMSKDEILEYYLNSVYFGGGSYGVQAAAEYYFAKDVEELGWAEGALLASLIASPNRYNPFNSAERAEKQRSLALRRLVETGNLTQEQADFIDLVPLPTTPNRIEPPRDYFVDEVKRQLLTDPRFNLGSTPEARARAVYQGGIKVYTTFDPVLQFQAIAARNATVPGEAGDGTFPITYVDPKTGEERDTYGTQAIVSVEPATGAVRTMVGGPGWDRLNYNLAIHRPGRQAGSTMKTFVAATLFEQGHAPDDALRGGSCTFTFPGEEPQRFGGRFGTITSMTQRSSNCGYMALGSIAGKYNVADLANRVGVKADLYDHDREGNPTAPPWNIALGTMDTTPLDLASAYATFANDGVYNEPYVVQRITDRDGRVVYEHEAEPRSVVDVRTARMVTEILVANVRGGTGTAAALTNGQPVGGKTGTTNESTDVWFVGYTPQLATAIWMGVPIGRVSMDRNPQLRGATGGAWPARTFGLYYNAIFADEPIVEFPELTRDRGGKSFGTVPYASGSSRGSSGRSGTGTTGGRSPTPTPSPAPEPTPPETAEPTPDGGGGGGEPGTGGGEDDGGGAGEDNGGDGPTPPDEGGEP